jgi:hypothetical protein
MTALQPLLDRGRYSDEEWKFASSGRCDWETANYPRVQRCGAASDPNSFYRWCTDHDEQGRRDNPDVYGV